MTIFKKRRNQTQTRIVRRGGTTVDVSPIRAAVVVEVLGAPRWEVNRGEFRGFGSPPGKF